MTEEEFHIQLAEARERGRAERQPKIDALKAERDAHRDNAQQLVEANATLKADIEARDRVIKTREGVEQILRNDLTVFFEENIRLQAEVEHLKGANALNKNALRLAREENERLRKELSVMDIAQECLDADMEEE